jgi:dTDP-4-dehydrorhamnose reductase
MSQHKTSILVTGSNGLLGQKLTDLLLTYPNVMLHASGTGKNRHPISTGYTYHTLDITDVDSVTKLLNTINPDVVIHSAAMTMVDACESEKNTCDQINIQATRHLANACARRNIHLVHVSTDFIFDGLKGADYNEEDVPNPVSYYGMSKWKGELCVMASGVSYSILRTVLVYGVVADMSRSNIVLWAKGALEKGQPLRVVNDQWRSPTLAEDLAQGCALAALQRARGIFNICGKETYRIDDMVRKIAIFWNHDPAQIHEINSESLQQPAKRPVHTGMSIQKAQDILGYAPKTFEEGLQLVQQQLLSLS